ncbi:competence protein CoiA family protein [Oceanobacillus neutriphilus]|uniref:Competence protein CoiA n=1 Tax=Oceanobacillus neutriphilus TaxID=531815 RepID=A0ABQ2NZF7_9BACI|nr:competence protein CoiA family protein [Oceanobacillus neutriphilus]GGP14441.1 competence protein CoiA [Oceanobacillus neutriphilus]
MQRAINKKGESVLLFRYSLEKVADWKQEKDLFYCPACKERVIIRSGERVTAHFAHLPNTECLLSGGGEGPYHEKGKLQLFNWLNRFNMQVELEAYFPEISQRADIFINIGGKKIAVEFQCARIPREVVLSRVQGYNSLGIKPVWILGAKYLKQKGAYMFQLNQFLDVFIRSSPQKDYPQLFFYDPFISEIAVLHHLYPLQASRLFAKQLVCPLHKLHFKHLFQKETKPENFAAVWVKMVSRRRTKVDDFYGEIFKLRKWLYRRGYLFQYLPSICFLPTPYLASVTVPYYKWQAELYVCCLADLKTGDSVHINQIKDILYSFYSKENSDFSDALEIYLGQLQQAGYIETHSSTILRTNREITCYSSQEQAFLGDQSFFKQFFTEKKAKYEHDYHLFRYTK